MDMIKDMGVFGVALFIITVATPLLLIARKGFKKEDSRKKKKKRTVLGTLFFLALSFFVFPGLLFLLYSFIFHVVMHKMPVETFKQSLYMYSFEPIINFYQHLLYLIRYHINNLFTVEK